MSSTIENKVVETSKDQMFEIAANWILDYEKMIVEIGCGDANFTKLLMERNISNYLGIDIDKEKIIANKIYYPQFRFMCTDISDNVHLLRKARMVISFETMHYIEDDLRVINNIQPYCKIIFSVPNSVYREKARYYELDGWIERFEKFITFNKTITIQNPRKPRKRLFLFKGIRNAYIDKKTFYVPEHYRFNNMMERVKGVTPGGK